MRASWLPSLAGVTGCGLFIDRAIIRAGMAGERFDAASSGTVVDGFTLTRRASEGELPTTAARPATLSRLRVGLVWRCMAATFPLIQPKSRSTDNQRRSHSLACGPSATLPQRVLIAEDRL